MRVALVHDWLNTKRGGAENVLLELADMYPDAPVFTLLYDPRMYPELEDGRVHTSSLQKLPNWFHRNIRYLLPRIPQAVEGFDLAEYDVVISSSSAWVKGVVTKPETLHICYCHTPMRFVWDYWPRYIDEQHVGPVRRAIIHRLTSKMRLWDFYSAKRVDRWIANSDTSAQRINKYYHQDATVIYPGVSTGKFDIDEAASRDYYVTLSNLTPYKKVDMAISAANQLGRNLVVIGEGPERARLEALAGPTVRFAGRVDDYERQKLLSGAKALIFASEEDFGIAPVEAMASGTPVIGYAKGGLTETIIDGKTGVLFNDPTINSLIAAIEQTDSIKFDSKTLRKHAVAYDAVVFRKKISAYVKAAHKDYIDGR